MFRILVNSFDLNMVPRHPPNSHDHCHPFWPPVVLILEKAMAPHSSSLAWKIPWTEEPGGLQSMGLLRVGHD